MNGRPIWTPDTSVVNRLADDHESVALIAGINAGFHPKLTFTSISEVIANERLDRRKRLIEVCRLLLSKGECLDPPHEILRKLVARFESTASFDWREVPVEFAAAQDYIARVYDFDEGLAEHEREEARTKEEAFVAVYAEAKGEFDQVAAKLAAIEAPMPRSVTDLVAPLQNGGAFWRVARNWYSRAAEHSVDDATVRRFYTECDPFRALMVAVCAALYERCVRPQHFGPSLRTGLNDTFMAIYLPYCDQLLTDDGRQAACYKEVAAIAGLGAWVRSYEDFRSSLSVCM